MITFFEVELQQGLGVATLGQLLDPENNIEGLAERVMDVREMAMTMWDCIIIQTTRIARSQHNVHD